MRERLRDRGRLMDIQEYAANAMQFAAEVNYEEFVKDRMRYFAIMKNVEIIGEAANMLTSDFRNHIKNFRGNRSSECVTSLFMAMLRYQT